MKEFSVIRGLSSLAIMSITGLLAACGSDSDNNDPVVDSTVISGYVVAAPVNGASVLVKDASGINTLAGPETTSADGAYSIDAGSALSGMFTVESSGGTYVDEANADEVGGGVPVTAETLSAYVDGANLDNGGGTHQGRNLRSLRNFCPPLPNPGHT